MRKFSVSKEIEFDAGHRVPDHASKCRNPHGHRYKVRAHVVGDLQTEGSSTGMVIDFGDIKKQLTEKVHDVFDHGFIVHEEDYSMLRAFASSDEVDSWKIIVVQWVPTAENMAKWIYEVLTPLIPGLWAIEVYETPTSIAFYPADAEQ